MICIIKPENFKKLSNICFIKILNKGFYTFISEILLFIDPPYGGRMELISNTLHMIEKEWRLLNNLPSSKVLPGCIILMPIRIFWKNR